MRLVKVLKDQNFLVRFQIHTAMSMRTKLNQTHHANGCVLLAELCSVATDSSGSGTLSATCFCRSQSDSAESGLTVSHLEVGSKFLQKLSFAQNISLRVLQLF